MEDKRLPRFTLLHLITAAGGLLPPTIVVPALKAAKKFFKRPIDMEMAYFESRANSGVGGVIYEAFDDRLFEHCA